jgi:hypothetical protein
VGSCGAVVGTPGFVVESAAVLGVVVLVDSSTETVDVLVLSQSCQIPEPEAPVCPLGRVDGPTFDFVIEVPAGELPGGPPVGLPGRVDGPVSGFVVEAPTGEVSEG